MNMIVIFRFVIIVLALLTIKDIAYLYSPFAVPDVAINHFSFFIAAVIYLLILFVVWNFPYTLLRVTDKEKKLSREDKSSDIGYILVFCTLLYWSANALLDCVYIVTDLIVSESVSKNQVIIYFAIFIASLIPLYYSKVISNWMYNKRK